MLAHSRSANEQEREPEQRFNAAAVFERKGRKKFDGLGVF